MLNYFRDVSTVTLVILSVGVTVKMPKKIVLKIIM